MKKYWLLALLVLTAACQQAPGPYTPAPLDFGNQAPIRLNVAEVRVVENYRSSLQAPYVEQEFPIMPAAGVKQWLKQRVQAIGTQGVFEVTIDDASAKETKLTKTEGWKSLITNDQDTRVDASLKVTMRLYDGTSAISNASGDVIITRSRTIDEKATVNDRTKLFESMGREMMAAFDKEATLRLQQYFSGYTKP